MKSPFTKLALRSSLFVLLLALSPALFAQDTQRQFLSGLGKDAAVPWRFQCTAGPQSGYWTNLPVPSNWELHGFGTLRYRRESDNATNEMGLYERDFLVPANWSGLRVFLVFDGVFDSNESAPSLTAIRLDASIVISWPTNTVGVVLEFTESLSPQSWRTETSIRSLSADQFTVTIPPVKNNRFYRLRAL